MRLGGCLARDAQQQRSQEAERRMQLRNVAGEMHRSQYSGFCLLAQYTHTAVSSSLSDLKNRSENSAERGQILPVLQGNSRSIDQKSGEI